MTADEIAAALTLVREETDLNSKSLLLAGLVSESFRERGFEPVIVGGSAIEFYTDGAYMSGDTDICWTGWPQPNNEERTEIMRQLPGIKSHGGRSWGIEGLWIDLLGEVDYRSHKAFSRFETPHGEVRLIPVEDALVERVYSARKWVNRCDEKDDDCAKKLMAAVVSGRLPIDWDEANRVAACSIEIQLRARVRCRKSRGGGRTGKIQILSYNLSMTPSKLKSSPERTWTWEQWQAGRAERRRLGNLVAPKNIRRAKSEGDEYLRETYDGERGPPFNKPFDPSADEK